jgi:hypothetical protein
MSNTAPDTQSETPEVVDIQTRKTTTVTESTTATPKKATGTTPAASNRQRATELRELLRTYSDYPQFKEKVDQLDAILKNIDADSENVYLTTVHASQLASIDTALHSMGEEVAKIPAIETKLNKVNGEVTLLRHDHNELFDRVNDATRIPAWHFVVATLLGLLAGVIAWFTMLGRNTLADGTVVDIPQIWIVAFLVGIALFALVLGILSMFRSRKSKEVEPERSAPAVPVNHQSIEPIPVAPATDTAPTKVLETEGANSGTR